MLTRTLKENPDVLALRDHRSELLIGRTIAGTLQLSLDSTGMRFLINLPKTATGDDTAENVRLGNLSGCSFGFCTISDSWSEDDKGKPVRTLLDIDLFEISVTSFPAYSATSVATRNCPVGLRGKLLRKKKGGDLGLNPSLDDIIMQDDDDDDDEPATGNDNDDEDDGEDEQRCDCPCNACSSLDDCGSCSDISCANEFCSACPSQVIAAHMALLTRRLR
jgi:HK97 family phage prohead protease